MKPIINIYDNENHFKALEKHPIEKKYDGYKVSSEYLETRDGIKLAADIHLPKGLKPDEKVPCILIQTRYWRATKFRKLFNRFLNSGGARDHLYAFTSFGFALVAVDVRGTGASFGSRIAPWSIEEVKDSNDIINWITTQSWSNGCVFPFGNSYSGTTAELSAISNNPAIKGIIAMHNEIDPYVDITFPGGILNEWFIKGWGQHVARLDRNKRKGIMWLLMKSVKPVDGKDGEELLKKAIKEHSTNISIAELPETIICRDDLWGNTGITVDNFSVFSYKDEISKSKIPIYYWGSWMDAKTSKVVIESFLSFDNPIIGVIGPWTHGSKWKANPYLLSKEEAEPNYQLQFQAWACFFNECVKENPPSDKVIFYYTMGQKKWKRTTIWPPKGFEMNRWFFNKNFILSPKIPQEEVGEDRYNIDFTAKTGNHTRWHTQRGGPPVIYEDRAEEDKKLLTYTSKALTKDIEITGNPIITLYLISSHKDGAIYTYLEEIDEEGVIHLLTEGQIRLIHRKLSKETPPYAMLMPYHSYKKKDMEPIEPGEITKVSFGLIPTSILIRKGRRLRVSIAGVDSSLFTRIPKIGDPSIIVKRNAENASYIDLPIIKN